MSLGRAETTENRSAERTGSEVASSASPEGPRKELGGDRLAHLDGGDGGVRGAQRLADGLGGLAGLGLGAALGRRARQADRFPPGGVAVVQLQDDEGESLSSFVETSVREAIERRRTRSEFIRRGLASRDEAKRTGEYIPAKTVHAELRRKLDKARRRVMVG